MHRGEVVTILVVDGHIKVTVCHGHYHDADTSMVMKWWLWWLWLASDVLR